MIKVINLASGEIVKVWNTEVNEQGEIVRNDGKDATARYLNSYPFLTLNGRDAEGRCRLTMAEGYEILKGRAKAKKPTPAPEPAEPTPVPTAEPSTPEPMPEPEPAPVEPVAEPVHIPEPAPAIQMGGVQDALTTALAPVFAGVAAQIKAEVKAETSAELEKLRRAYNTQVRTIEIKTTRSTNKVTGIFRADFERILYLIEMGKPVYMYGPAGCGKSFTAKQLADALGIPYFETSQAMFAHDLKGYGDAMGKYVGTPFYEAFKQGGLFFLDEVDASAPEAVVVLNNAIANRRFTFPVVGEVEAHPNFRVVAAGNTKLTGQTLAYTARQVQDASFKNRFFFLPSTYDERIEIELAGGDEEIVKFAHDLRKAARETGIEQLCSYRQIEDLAQLAGCNDDAWLVRGSVLQEKEADEVRILHEHLENKGNRWAKAMKAALAVIEEEQLW